MAILKTVSTPTGAQVSFHKLVGSTVDYAAETSTLRIASWATPEQHDLGQQLTWMWEVSGPQALVTNYTPDQALLLVPEFEGAAIVPDNSNTLYARKLRKWAEVKLWRAESISTDMVTPFGVFQCRDEDRQNITAAVLLAQTLSAAGQPVALDWTLADNSVVTLDATQIVTVGLLLGQKVQAAHAVARGLRNQIEVANSNEAVDVVAWPN